MRNETLAGVGAGRVLAPGAVVSGRFEIVGLGPLLGQIVVYDAKDQRTQRSIALWAVPPRMLKPEALAVTRAAVKAAGALASKDLVTPFGSSTDASGTLFVATEPLGTTHVGELLAHARGPGRHTIAAAFELLLPAIAALTAAHPNLSHGAVAPVLLRTDERGRVRVAGLGLSAALIAANAVDEQYLAPEVRAGAQPSPRADVYSLGAVLFELVTGQPVDAARAPSDVAPGLPAAFDIIIENCLAGNPDDRFASLAELRAALTSLAAPSLKAGPLGPDAGVDVPIEFDVDVDSATSTPVATAPPVAASRPLAPTAAVSLATPHAVGERGSLAEMPAPATEEPRMSNVDLRGLLDEATANDAPRWMFVRGGLDHGPLSARELIQAIVRHEVTSDDVVFNMDSGERRKLHQWPQYAEFGEQAREKRKKDQHAREVRSAIAEESTSTKAKTAVAIALVAMVGIIAVVYVKTLSPSARQKQRQAQLDDAVARGQLRLAEGGLQVLEAPSPQQSRSSGGGGRRGGGGGGFAGSYEAAMNAPVEYNFGGAGPGNGSLSDSQISAPLNAALSRFGSCATAEIARGGSARQVQMRIAVAGSGAPIGVSVGNGSGAFKSCVGGIVRGLRWHSFNGPRIGFAWGFSLQ